MRADPVSTKEYLHRVPGKPYIHLLFNILIGYSIDIFDPNDPDTHSIFAFFPAIAFLVFKFNMFLDQFSIVEYLRYALSLTYSSTHPACKLTLLYLGAEHPSTK